MKDLYSEISKILVPNLSGIRSWFCGKKIFHEPGMVGGESFRMIQVVAFIVHFNYYYISFTSDHQTVDPGGWIRQRTEVQSQERTWLRSGSSWQDQYWNTSLCASGKWYTPERVAKLGGVWGGVADFSCVPDSLRQQPCNHCWTLLTSFSGCCPAVSLTLWLRCLHQALPAPLWPCALDL